MHFVDDFFRSLDVELLAINVGRVPAAWIPTTAGFGAVYSWPGAWPGPFRGESSALAAAEEGATARAERVAELRGPAGAEPLGEVGDPALEITRAAIEIGAELVVVGSGHKGLLERFFTGSVATELVREGALPILLVP